MFKQLFNDEAGFIVSAELVLVATLLVIGMIVGLSEVQHAVVQELNDVADAVGAVNQSYAYTGFHALKDVKVGLGPEKSYSRGSSWGDEKDDCDNNQCAIACDGAAPEGNKTF